jgi:hypothetical protein
MKKNYLPPPLLVLYQKLMHRNILQTMKVYKTKTIIILLLRMPKYLLPNTNNRKRNFTHSKRKGHKRRETVTLPKHHRKS